MDGIKRTFSIDIENFLDPRAHLAFCFFKFRRIRRRAFRHLAGEIIRQRVGQNEIAVGQTLHEGAGSEPVGAVIGKVRFADHKQAGHVAHQIVIDPEPAHRVMHRRINSHRHFVGVFAGDFFVDFEQISVAVPNRVFAQAFDRVGKIEIHAAPAGTDAAAFIANFLRRAR